MLRLFFSELTQSELPPCLRDRHIDFFAHNKPLGETWFSFPGNPAPLVSPPTQGPP